LQTIEPRDRVREKKKRVRELETDRQSDRETEQKKGHRAVVLEHKNNIASEVMIIGWPEEGVGHFCDLPGKKII